MSKQVTLIQGGINWDWYMTLTIEPNTHVTVSRYWREHKSEVDNTPIYDGYIGYTVESDDKQRTLVGVHFALGGENGFTYVVSNPKHIFDYQ